MERLHPHPDTQEQSKTGTFVTNVPIDEYERVNRYREHPELWVISNRAYDADGNWLPNYVAIFKREITKVKSTGQSGSE